ncbi:GNAT family N-acetyltransferase [Dictyobacter aurantiacus]|uniref:GNAT family N-acetyltransferase n=1 Tax=Dictyobacter aurantiacus TaxID=1936993 RepID=A0A401ZAN5_9CHLR|nr:GNAT family N-acetyltransferase [Dictyobacter aurantiacus]GCE03866.1 GNAT family N-acetyltransferase [Dictyobacter aurantiacus]
MAVTIREARLEDSGAITTILRALGWSEHIQQQTFAETQAQIEEWFARLENEQTHTILVAEQQGQVVGYLAVHWYFHLMRGSDGYVSELFIHPDQTGHGIGSQLLATIEEEARRRGCTRLILMNRRIRESYARQFYIKHGWEELGDAAFFSLTLPATSR